VSWAVEEKGYTQRRACRLVGMEPKTYRYVSTRPDEAGLRTQLKQLANERRRFGYRRLHILLKRAGVAINHKKLDTSKNRFFGRLRVNSRRIKAI